MNCLVIAAGSGSRLRSVSDSKPLTEVGGTALIEHVINGGAAAGATEFTVVTGHEAERVEAFLGALASRLGVSIRTVRTPDWRRPNGHPVAAGAEAIRGDFLLLMSDHLFDAEIARRLLGSAPAGADMTLAVDRNCASPMLDLDDATKVEVDRRGAIVRIGKTLEPYDAIDTGIFLATPALAEAIRADIAAGGEGSLSSGVQRLADEGRAWTVDVTGERWLDVDDLRSLALAEELLRGLAEVRGNAA
jgi:choline kinase